MTSDEARQYIIAHCCPNYENPADTKWDTAMAMAIEALQERKIGKWKKILIATVPITIYGYECPFCDFRTATNNFNFCPHCGKKMEGYE